MRKLFWAALAGLLVVGCSAPVEGDPNPPKEPAAESGTSTTPPAADK